MNLRRLAYFVLACQQRGLAGAAEELGVTQSTLSVSLKTLSETLGIPLFEHVQRRFHPTAAGLWLFRSGLPLLHAESFARSWVVAGGAGGSSVPHYLVVDVRLSFALGRVTKAVSSAIEALRERFPDTFIELHFSGAGLSNNDTVPIGLELRGGAKRVVIIDAVSACDEVDREDGKTVSPLLRDEWVFVNAHAATASPEPPSAPVVVPALSGSLRRQVARFVEERRIPGVQAIDESPGALPRLVLERPHAIFMLPASMVAERLSQANVGVRRVGAGFHSDIVAIHDASDEVARCLVDAVRARLGAPERNVVFQPRLTIRQLHYFQTLYRWRNVTAAARSLSVAQPSVTEQLRKMESVLGCRLFERSRDGLDPTPAGERMNAIGTLIEDGVRRLRVQRASVNGMQGNQLRLGILPTSDSSSLMLQCVANAIARWQSAHPVCRLKVFEAPSSNLQELVANGTISLAVIERDITDLARLGLGPGEPLALIVDPALGMAAGNEIEFARAARLPLVLPTSLSGIRQLLDAAADREGLRLNVVAEINSMALTVAMLRRQAACTILPVSAIRRYLGSGSLMAIPIVRPSIERRFYVIYSTDRKLGEHERAFVGELRDQFEHERPEPR